MAVTRYCTEFELNALWSEFGVTSRTDGNRDGEEDAHAVLNVIEEASVRVNMFLFQRYTVAVCAASAFVRWATAHIAAHLLGSRYGLSRSEGMATEYQWYIDQLTAIRDGKMPLMDDDGLATPRFDSRPAVSNFSIDGRFKRSKVRKVQATSTDVTPADGTKEKPSLDYLTGGFSQ